MQNKRTINHAFEWNLIVNVARLAEPLINWNFRLYPAGVERARERDRQNGVDGKLLLLDKALLLPVGGSQYASGDGPNREIHLPYPLIMLKQVL